MLKTQSRFGLGLLSLLVLAVGAGRGWAAGDAPAGPHIVMIIRHAEKPEAKTDADLSKKGFERADALATAIPAHFPRPDYLIATMRSKHSNRPVETITPLGKALNEPVEAKYKDKDYAQLAHKVLTDPKYAGKTVLIAWHHGTIPELAKALGAKDVPDEWKGEVFNRVWEITYENGGATWKEASEDALPGDSKTTESSASEPKHHKHAKTGE